MKGERLQVRERKWWVGKRLSLSLFIPLLHLNLYIIKCMLELLLCWVLIYLFLLQFFLLSFYMLWIINAIRFKFWMSYEWLWIVDIMSFSIFFERFEIWGLSSFLWIESKLNEIYRFDLIRLYFKISLDRCKILSHSAF